MKKCTLCGAVKDENEFYKNGEHLRGECKECTKMKRRPGTGTGTGTFPNDNTQKIVIPRESSNIKEVDGTGTGTTLPLVKGKITIIDNHYHGASKCYICNSITSFVVNAEAPNARTIQATVCHNCIYSIEIDAIRIYALPNGTMFFMVPIRERKVNL